VFSLFFFPSFFKIPHLFCSLPLYL
jgi:hypothetical protein